MPKISLITVSYNCQSTLQATIDSVRKQSAFTQIEYLVIDGISNDGTLDVIKENAETITKWISEKDQGIYDAMNKGLKMATCEWIGFLHADDTFASEKVIEEIILATEHQAINAIYGNLNYIDKDNERIVRHWQSKPFEPSLLKKGWMPPHPTLYIKKELFERIGPFNTAYKIAADYDFILRLFSHPQTVPFFIDRLIVNMRLGGASNKSIKNIVRKSSEDLKALRTNKIGGLRTLFFKNFGKLNQFFKKG